jgi:hypothetical protein
VCIIQVSCDVGLTLRIVADVGAVIATFTINNRL